MKKNLLHFIIKMNTQEKPDRLLKTVVSGSVLQSRKIEDRFKSKTKESFFFCIQTTLGKILCKIQLQFLNTFSNFLEMTIIQESHQLLLTIAITPLYLNLVTVTIPSYDACQEGVVRSEAMLYLLINAEGFIVKELYQSQGI